MQSNCSPSRIGHDYSSQNTTVPISQEISDPLLRSSVAVTATVGHGEMKEERE